MKKKPNSLRMDPDSVIVEARPFPGDLKLYLELCKMKNCDKITKEEAVRRMRRAEVEYYGGPPEEGDLLQLFYGESKRPFGRDYEG